MNTPTLLLLFASAVLGMVAWFSDTIGTQMLPANKAPLVQESWEPRQETSPEPRHERLPAGLIRLP